MNSANWGFFALVSYVPHPLGPCLDGLRQALPGTEFRQAHITLLPPRPLQVPVDAASKFTHRILDDCAPFEIRLQSVRRFPTTNVLYLDLAQGGDTVHKLHDALNAGELAFKEQFEFQPHLTLAGPVPDERIDAVQARAEHLWKSIEPNGRFTVTEIVALWSQPGAEPRSWQRLWSFSLDFDRTRSAHAGVTGQRS
jgi:2'-5' RNA ligase